MGIESDQLVYDYLSRVGDLAQQRQLPASDRMKLVSTLRNEIDRRRATYGEESPAAVRGILGALGTPDEVVERAEDAPGGGTPVPPPRSASQGRGTPAPPPRSASPGRRTRPGKRPSPSVPQPRESGREPDWWRTDTTDTTDADIDGLDALDALRAPDIAGAVPGFVGGIERPDLFEPPAPEEYDDEEDEDEESAPRRRWRRLARAVLRRKPAPEPEHAEGPDAAEDPETAAPTRRRLGNPFVLLAALLLIGGAAFGSLVALAAGWLLACASRRLTPGEVKGAVLVVPGLAAATGVVWLWGRVEGRWGEAVAPGGPAMSAAISETWPWVLRGAAVASALFLLWRSRRH
ncbi:hypothetical protein [Streptomyces sp. NBC_00094]|uniref:hypothetical protein n=1 Tax=Streptomyces sp. NBC_00094 TaxID=2903620 RepID=UPI00224E1BFD|nr:hypothetical protein [Streptomyces sp. NBC_00094]MCX5392323.1 hypothetical protein [Streptomyces sp. NBC_00094]